MKFRKRPVVIDAVQFTGVQPWPEGVYASTNPRERGEPVCWTLEGPLHVSVGDWIIKGVKGEVYPCKPDVFAATYEPAEDPFHPPSATAAPGDDGCVAPFSSNEHPNCPPTCGVRKMFAAPASRKDETPPVCAYCACPKMLHDQHHDHKYAAPAEEEKCPECGGSGVGINSRMEREECSGCSGTGRAPSRGEVG